MTAAQAASAGDPVGLEHGKRGVQRLDSGQMRAIGACTRDQCGTAIEQQRGIASLNGPGDRLGSIDQGPLVRILQPKQDGCNVTRAQRADSSCGTNASGSASLGVAR